MLIWPFFRHIFILIRVYLNLNKVPASISNMNLKINHCQVEVLPKQSPLYILPSISWPAGCLVVARPDCLSVGSISSILDKHLLFGLITRNPGKSLEANSSLWTVPVTQWGHLDRKKLKATENGKKQTCLPGPSWRLTGDIFCLPGYHWCTHKYNRVEEASNKLDKQARSSFLSILI